MFPATGPALGSIPIRTSDAFKLGADGDITLNFVNTDVRDVVKAVLGDYLHLNYVVDPSAQGAVTLQTSRPITRDALIPVLEQALKLNGLALIRVEDLYKVVASTEAPKQSGITSAAGGGASQPGYGVEIARLRYVSASEMLRLLQPLAPTGVILNADEKRGMLLIAGSEQERSAVLDDIALFDVDWLAGMSFTLFSPKSVEARELAKELNDIIGGAGSPMAGVVRLVVIDRLNAVLAISAQTKYLSDLQGWVERLDHPGQSIEHRIFVYHVQNGRAKDLAGVLTQVLSRGGPSLAPSANSQAGGITQRQPDVTLASTTLPAAGLGQAGAGTDNPRPPATGQANDVTGQPASGEHGIDVGSLKDLNITADETNNALVILASPRDYAVIEAALRQLDTVPLQVLLDAVVAEVTLNKNLQYGLQYSLQPNKNNQIVLSAGTTSSVAPTYPAFTYAYSSGTTIQAVLSALDAVTHVNVISAPKVLVLNNQTATLQVGDEVPVATQQAVSVGAPGAPVVNSIEFMDTGVILKVTPRVNQGGMVMMDISQEVSDVSPTTSSTLDSPTISQRKIASTVAIKDGETIALGGLITDSRTKTDQGIPVLHDIPVFGALFGTKEDQVVRTELLVLITPHVVENLERARAVTEELKEKLPEARQLVQ